MVAQVLLHGNCLGMDFRSQKLSRSTTQIKQWIVLATRKSDSNPIWWENTYPVRGVHLISLALRDQLKRPHVVLGARYQDNVLQLALYVVKQVLHLATESISCCQASSPPSNRNKFTLLSKFSTGKCPTIPTQV